jgi:extracellular factor (EF) 3-hydroxypalmitic acid methyl ester biosynthesis protein
MHIVHSADTLRGPSRQEANPAGRSPINDLMMRMAESHADLLGGRVGAGMHRIASTLSDLRASLSADQWRALCNSAELRPIRTVLYEDPHAHRAYVKPRGYAGDAVLLDYVYGCAPLPEYTTPLGREIYQWSAVNSAAFRSVRHRRSFLAQLIDATAARKPKARVLAVASGHLREAHLSNAVVGGGLAELVAVDQDAFSLDVVRGNCTGLPVRCAQVTIGDLITGRLELGRFDLIYAPGLYDYLPDKIARRLTTSLVSRLTHGGELVIGNFVHCPEAGYMEAIMDWCLLYRTEDQLLSLANEVRDAVMRIWTDQAGLIGYLALSRC